jgi:hypothetical protein
MMAAELEPPKAITLRAAFKRAPRNRVLVATACYRR